MTAVKRRAIDSLRRGQMLLQKHEAIARELEWQQQQLRWSTPWIASDLIGAAVVSTPSILTGKPGRTRALSATPNSVRLRI
jgi:hypothetical protein